MHFQRLRLSGFKSFVEPTEFRIEAGLTGVVGPNGCGKSNLLEGLRWVMGASSAKAMRGGAMDDVIFGGTDARASRNHAEVLLQIDNSDRTAPAQFNDHPVLEVTRRIDRGAGSTYRVNGVEARARDVQLLFADASTGANSPSLVRQGQISELISAKPSNRRRILEEAAGVSGLHSRRHEADLRLRAAEANLERIDLVVNELESGFARLKRESRQAEKYRRLSAEIRALHGAALYARWREGDQALTAANAARTASDDAVHVALRRVTMQAAEAEQAANAVRPLREEAAVAATLHQRLLIERDRTERERHEASALVDRLKAERSRIAADHEREIQLGADAAAALSRLSFDLRELKAALSDAGRTPELETAAAAASAARAAADQEVERLATEAAAAAALQQGAAEALTQAQARMRAAALRIDESEARNRRISESLASARAQDAALAQQDPALQAAMKTLETAEAALQKARAAAEQAEAARNQAHVAEDEAKERRRRALDAISGLRAEREGLDRLQASSPEDDFTPAFDQVTPDRGFEAALGAALGEDLDAALDPRATRFWGGAKAEAPRWPKGASPLSDWVQTPPAMAARLAFTALVAQEDGQRLQGVAPIGARLVSREGDLWRWDGFTVRAEAPKPAAVRLAQRARLIDLAREIVSLEPELAISQAALESAERSRAAKESALRAAKVLPVEAEQAVAEARKPVEALSREDAKREARRQSLGETITRLQGEADDVWAGLSAAAPEREASQQAFEMLNSAPLAEAQPNQQALHQARTSATAARLRETAAHGAFDQERRAKDGRLRRREALDRDHGEWVKRASAADARVSRLQGERERILEALGTAEDAPNAVEVRLQSLLSEFAAVEARRSKASEQLETGETQAALQDRELRGAETIASQARETRAAAEARQVAALEHVEALADHVRRTLKEEPETLGDRLRAEAVAIPADAEGVETHIANLERERDSLGAVNLRAEEDMTEAGRRLQTIGSERADLLGAVARLRSGIEELNKEGRDRLQAAFTLIDESFRALFETLFQGGQAELRLVEASDPLEAGLEIYACPPGKKLAAMSLMSGGEQALTATALIFAVFLANPSPVCVLDEVDAPLDDANVDRFCTLLDEMRRRTQTRFIVITHHPVTMSRVDRLYGVTMPERGVSQLVSVDLRQAEALAAE